MNGAGISTGVTESAYRVLTYTSKNDFYVLNVDKTKKEESKGLSAGLEDQRINTGSGDSEEEEGSTKSHDSSKVTNKKKLRSTLLDTLQLNIA